jgi:hypothetical protein
MAKSGPGVAGSKLGSQVQAMQITGLPQARPAGYPAKAAQPKATPAVSLRPYREGPSSRGVGKMPTVRWK